MKKTLFYVVLGICLMLAFAACDNTANTTTAVETTAAATTAAGGEVAAEGRVITDMNGNQITVPKDVKKIMTCVTVGTQTLLLLGDVDNVVTLGQGFNYAEGSIWRDMYPGLDNVPVATRNDAANTENVAKIAPDVVLIDVPDTAQKLNTVGVPALIQKVNSSEDLKTSVKLMAELIGGDAIAEAEQFCKYYDDVMNSVKEKTKNLKDEDKPLVWFARGVANTVGAGSIAHDWLVASGGRNMAAELGKEGSRIELTAEEILKVDPDIIICEHPNIYEAIVAEEKYSGLKAIKNGAVYCTPAGAGVWAMASAENALQWVWAPTIIQPELFADTDVEAAVKAFYKDFYEYDLTAEQLDAIMNPVKK